MSTWSRDLASDFINYLSEDEIFSMPIVDAAGGAELGFGDSAGVSPLKAVLQRRDGAELEAALEAFLNETSTAHGLGVLEEAAHERALRPAFTQRSVEMWPNAGGQLAALARDAPALPDNMAPFRRSVNHSPHVKRRRAAGIRSIPDTVTLPAPGAGPQRRRSRVDISEVGRRLEYRPLTEAPNPTIIVEEFPSMLRHPFDASIIPVMYSVNRAHEHQARRTRGRCQPFSAPAIGSTAVTVRPVQDQMECQQMNLDKPRFGQTTMMSSTYDFSKCPLAERVLLVGLNHGTVLCSAMKRLIYISSSNAPSNRSIQDTNSWGPINCISSPATDHIPERAAPQSELKDVDAKISKQTRLSWTPELINKFEAAIALLGGPDKATPRAIVRCMACPQVTILQVKSRLQKFRLLAGIVVDTSRGTKRNRASRVTHEKINPEDAFEAEVMLDQEYETCKDWTEQLEAQNVNMRHWMAVHHTITEAHV